MTKDWVHGVGHSPVCKILLQIVMRVVVTSSPPAWTSIAGMLSTPAERKGHQLAHIRFTHHARISPQWLSELKWLCLSVSCLVKAKTIDFLRLIESSSQKLFEVHRPCGVGTGVWVRAGMVGIIISLGGLYRLGWGMSIAKLIGVGMGCGDAGGIHIWTEWWVGGWMI